MLAWTNRIVLLGLALAVLTGCGFSLRGSDGPLRLEAVTLEADRTDGMVRVLHQQLRSLGVETGTTRNGTDDHYTLILRNEQRDARRTTLNTGTRGAQYELVLTVEATLMLDGTVIAGPRTHSVQRQHDEDLSNLTSSGSERNLLYDNMERELADQIVQQLRTIPPVAGSTPR